MDERRQRLPGPSTDDADARGEHRYPDEGTPERPGADEAREALTRDPDQYVAGADGTQTVTTGESEQ